MSRKHPNERAEMVAFINETADLISRLGKVRDEGAAAERRRIVALVRERARGSLRCSAEDALENLADELSSTDR